MHRFQNANSHSKKYEAIRKARSGYENTKHDNWEIPRTRYCGHARNFLLFLSLNPAVPLDEEKNQQMILFFGL